LILGKYLLLKDKQFYTRERRLLGPALAVAKKLSDFVFLHIHDLDFEKGLTTNFDVYDKLTYFIHVQVEVYREKGLETLREYNVRLVAIPGHFSDPSLYQAIMTDDLEIAKPFKDVVTQNPEFLKTSHRVFYLWKKEPRAYASILP